MESSLKIGLFDPGMTALHRVGLAGLYMTLKRINPELFEGALTWELSERQVVIRWTGDMQERFDLLFKESFGTDDMGLLSFAAHRGHAMSSTARIALSEAVRMSFLQHNKQNMIPKGTPDRTLSLQLDDKTVLVSYKPFVNAYAHSIAAKDMPSGKKIGQPVVVKGWLYPGAAERHVGVSGTEIEEPLERYMCLLYAPTASLYFRLRHRNLDGKNDERRGTAVVVPHVRDLAKYERCFSRYLTSPVERLTADGIGDAGLVALVTLAASDSLESLGVTGCTGYTMGTVDWAKQQKTRTAVLEIGLASQDMLRKFETAYKNLGNRQVVNQPKPSKKEPNPPARMFVAPSLCRGVLAENIACGREWFRGFAQLTKNKKLFGYVLYERGGLNKMLHEIRWDTEADKKLVEAIHVAMRNRFGKIAVQAKTRGEAVRFDREFERLRTGLMRAKNVQTLRSEMADIFARGGINAVLQDEWRQVLPLMTGADWQRTRDLALLALASYAGKEATTIEIENSQADEEE